MCCSRGYVQNAMKYLERLTAPPLLRCTFEKPRVSHKLCREPGSKTRGFVGNRGVPAAEVGLGE